jgi:hypothetical protein
MCFSAEASFTAAVVLTAIGTGLMIMRKPNTLKYLSTIPFLFALQQASEGALWLLLPTAPESFITHLFQYSYLFFAFVVWPVWIPFALFMAEKVTWRKIALGFPVLAGIAFAIFDLSYVQGNQMTVQIVGNSISYNMQHSFDWNEWLVKGAYCLITLAPCFLSSLKLIKGYGFLIIASWISAALLFQSTFTSTWCFFAAIISLYLVIVVRENRE